MAGVGFKDQPEFTTRLQVEGAGGAESDVDFEEGAGLNFADHGDAALLDGFQSAVKDVAGAEPDGALKSEENIAGADGDANVVAGLGVTEWNFDRRS